MVERFKARFGKKYNILLLGLYGSGKRQFLDKLKFKNEPPVTTLPTIGYNIETVSYKNLEITMWDFDGQDKIRPLWRHYFQGTQGMVYVVDSNDRERIGEARDDLHCMLNEDELRDADLLVFADNQDLPNAMNAAEVTDKLRLHALRNRNWYIQAATLRSGDGIYEGLDWLRHQVKSSEKTPSRAVPSAKPASETPSDIKRKKQKQILEEKRQRHKEAYERVIKEKFTLPIHVVRFNNVGLPRSGKTSFRRRMMGEILNILEALRRGETEQPSTGVAEAGGQVFISNRTRFDLGAIKSKVWCVVGDLKEEAGMVSQLFFQRVQGDTSTDHPKDGGSELPDHPLKGASAAKSSSKRKHLKRSLLKALSSLSKSSRSSKGDSFAATDKEIEEMFGMIRDAMEAENWDEVKYLLEDLILLVSTDTGGQAEFLDLHASLVQGPSFNLLFSRLVDDLDSQFEVYYTNEEGMSTEKEDSIMTVEQVLFQSLSTIACYSGTFCDGEDTPSSGGDTHVGTKKFAKSKVLFVGTHADLVSKEKFVEKDRLLQKRIKGTEFYDKGIIEFASKDQLMLAVNNRSGGQDEIDEIRKILERVIVKSFEKVTIPASWLMLSLHIRSKKVRTMSLEECEELGRKVGIIPSELQDALWFLHNLGILLYYPELDTLKGTVICDIQVVFDSATNLIKNTFTFDKVGQSVSEKFREKAQFSLKDVQRATSGYTDDLISLEKLVELLEYLSVLTVIPSTPSSGAQEPIYFMPCVLRSARASELSVCSRSDSDPAPLMLCYDCGYVPVGMFPSMITNLVSQQQEDWEMVGEGLRKNRVQFLVGEDCDKITLISHPRYFEIVVSRREDFQTRAESLCANVRGRIQSTLKAVTSHMNSHFKMGYRFGFECPLHPGREHLCKLARVTARFMMCQKNPKELVPLPLEPRHKVWFAEESNAVPVDSRPGCVSTAPTGPPVTGLNLQGYLSALPAGARPHLELEVEWGDIVDIAYHMLGWEEKLCTHLGLTQVDLHDIKVIHKDNPSLQRREALSRWRNNSGIRGTYWNLLELFVRAGHQLCAEAVCEVLRKKYPSSSKPKHQELHL